MIVTVPAFTPVTSPDVALTLAIVASLEDHATVRSVTPWSASTDAESVIFAPTARLGTEAGVTVTL